MHAGCMPDSASWDPYTDKDVQKVIVADAESMIVAETSLLFHRISIPHGHITLSLRYVKSVIMAERSVRFMGFPIPIVMYKR